MSSVADIPLNRYLGIVYQEDSQSLSLLDDARIHNYFGSVSFCAQFALAEAASAQYLFDRLGLLPSRFHCNILLMSFSKFLTADERSLQASS